jgi:hypothetical protein
MNIQEYADCLHQEIVVRYYPNQDRWTAQFEHCEVMVAGGFLRGSYGNGGTPAEALKDYVTQLRGNRIAFNAMTEKRVEYVVPAALLP